MRRFSLHQPRKVPEAVQLLAEHGLTARPLGGGTDLVAGVMRDQLIGRGMPYPTELVDVTTIAELSDISAGPDGCTIGAAATLADIAESAEIAGGWPLLADTAANVASAEIRAIGTLGGNIHQRPRCWFFRSKDFDCIKKGGDTCYAVKGDNRYNAIIGGHLCFIVHPSDMGTALLALDAHATVADPDGERDVPFDEYFVGPSDNLLQETVLRSDQMLTSVRVPPAEPHTRQAWLKLSDKGLPTWDFAVVSAAVSACVIDGVWQGGRIVLGGVAPVPYRAVEVEDALAGRNVYEAAHEASKAIRAAARPMPLNGYKVDLAELVIERALVKALAADPVRQEGR